MSVPDSLPGSAPESLPESAPQPLPGSRAGAVPGATPGPVSDAAAAPVSDAVSGAAAVTAGATAPARTAYGQFRTALGFCVRDQTRNRLAGLLLLVFVPVWYLLLKAMAGKEPLDFRLSATGEVLHVDAAHVTLITAGLNSLTMITGFVVFDAVRKALPFDRRLVFAGYRPGTLVGARALAVLGVTAAVAAYTAVALLLFWRPSLAGWASILAGYAVIAVTYGALGLLLGVLVRNDLEGFFLIIMGGLTDTFLQNPLGNPLANKPVLEYFPSFGPMQFAVGGSLGGTHLPGHLALGLVWAGAFAALGLAIFHLRTRSGSGRH